jgi:predicted AlkP superfamily phosphohydrolase/phosphomutase
MNMAGKVLVIGLDGADWRILRPYLDQGVMPNLAHLVATGVSGDLRSTIPTNSSVAWNTFMTGRNPGKHGVYDFTERAPHDPTRMVGVNSRARRSETFYDTLARHGRLVGSINVPITYPPFPVNGFMISGMIVQEGKPYTFPESLAAELDERVGGFPVNRIRWRFMLGKLEELLDEALVVTQQRIRVLEYLIDHKEWDVLVHVFVTPDRLQHPLMHVLDSDHPCYDRDLAQRLRPKLCAIFQLIDTILGRAQERIGDDATLLIISDHGFRSVHKAIHIRQVLARAGLLKTLRSRRMGLPQLARKWLRHLPPAVKQALGRQLPGNGRRVGSPEEMANLDWSQTQAYVTTMTSQAVYANLTGREPHGIVAPDGAYERLMDDIQELLLSERDPTTGKPVIEAVLRANEVYHGPWARQGPDLLLLPAPGYAFAKGAKGHLQPYEWFMGDHALDGILVGSGPGLKRGASVGNAALIDLAPTILYLADVPIPLDMDGQVLDLFADQRLTTAGPIYEQDVATYQRHDYDYTAEEEQEVAEQLRGLGYL